MYNLLLPPNQIKDELIINNTKYFKSSSVSGSSSNKSDKVVFEDMNFSKFLGTKILTSMF